MDDWECTLCGELLPASEIVTMNHYRLIHPDKDISMSRVTTTWPDGGVAYLEDFDTPGDIIDPDEGTLL